MHFSGNRLKKTTKLLAKVLTDITTNLSLGLDGCNNGNSCHGQVQAKYGETLPHRLLFWTLKSHIQSTSVDSQMERFAETLQVLCLLFFKLLVVKSHSQFLY